MADGIDPATMDALNALGEEIAAEAGSGTEGQQPPADAGAQHEPPEGDEAATDAPEGQEQAPEDAAGEGEAEANGDEQPAAKKPTPKRSGVEKDVQRLLRERYEARNKQAEAEAAAAALRREIEELRAARAAPADPAAPQSQQPPVIQRQGESGNDFEARVQAEAVRRSEAAAFNDACNRVAAKGIETHKDFGEAQGALMGAFGRQVNGRPEFLQAITRLENGHDVFHHLGTNLEEAEKLFSHTDPVGLVMAMGDLSAKLKTPKVPKISNAPAPVTPIRGGGNGRSSVRLDDDKTPIDDWSKQFLKEIAS